MSKEFKFFVYLIESYAIYKGMETSEVLNILSEKKLIDFVYDSYQYYHTEAIENAFRDIDSLIATGKPAW